MKQNILDLSKKNEKDGKKRKKNKCKNTTKIQITARLYYLQIASEGVHTAKKNVTYP